MSYDILAFDVAAAPHERQLFLAWDTQQQAIILPTGWNCPDNASPSLRKWLDEMVEAFPPLNGPLGSADPDDPVVTDYGIGQYEICASFSWSIAKQAIEHVKQLAAKHQVGVYELSSEDGEIWLPDEKNGLTLASSKKCHKLAIWKRSALTKTAMLKEVYQSICEGRHHEAMTAFGAGSVMHALNLEFNSLSSEVVSIETGGDKEANWLMVNCARMIAQDVQNTVLKVALEKQLLVYDPKREVVWGNIRPAKQGKSSVKKVADLPISDD